MKIIIKIVGLSLATTLVLVLSLLLTRNYILDYLVDYIEIVRGTSHYEGESKAVEFWFILTRIIIPFLLGTTLVFYGYFFRNSKNR